MLADGETRGCGLLPEGVDGAEAQAKWQWGEGVLVREEASVVVSGFQASAASLDHCLTVVLHWQVLEEQGLTRHQQNLDN